MVDVEAPENVEHSLRYLKDILGVNPEYITVDFSPSIISPLESIYGRDKIIADGFHVVQLINRAIHKNILQHKDGIMNKPMKILIKLRNEANNLMEKLKNKKKIAKSKKFISYNNKTTPNDMKNIIKFSEQIKRLIQISDIPQFSSELIIFLSEKKQESDLPIVSYALSIEDLLPKRDITEKRMEFLKEHLLKKLKTLLVTYRLPIEEEKRLFQKHHWLLLKNPKKMKTAHHDKLAEFLSKYPELHKFRELTVQVGSLYRLPLDEVNEDIILNLSIQDDYCKEVVAAITTLKKNIDIIMRFKDLRLKNIDLPKKCHANMEYFNPKLKRIIRNGHNMKCDNRLKFEIQCQLGGEVRSF